MSAARQRDDYFYWEGLRRGELLVRVCDRCGRGAFPPMPGCPHCGFEHGTVTPSSGRGTLYTWTVSHVPFDPAFAAHVPYVIGVVELPEGARLVVRVVDVEPDALRAGMALAVQWTDPPPGSDPDLTMVRFGPVDAEEGPR